MKSSSSGESKGIIHIEAVAHDIDVKTITRGGYGKYSKVTTEAQLSFQDINGESHVFNLSRVHDNSSRPILITWAKGDRGILAYKPSNTGRILGKKFVKFYVDMTQEQYDRLSGKATSSTIHRSNSPKKASDTPRNKDVPLRRMKLTEEERDALRRKMY